MSVREDGYGGFTVGPSLSGFGVYPACGHELSAGDIVWLREDCGLDCDDCHADALREDPSDAYDHGTQYRLTSRLDECIVLEKP